MTSKEPKSRMTVGGLMLLVAWCAFVVPRPLGDFLGYLQWRKVRRESPGVKDWSDEAGHLYFLMATISTHHPDGVDADAWKSIIDMIEDEFREHELRANERVKYWPLIQENKAVFYSSISKYLEKQLEAGPIDVESLPPLRGRIVQDLDISRLRDGHSYGKDHARDCLAEFEGLMDSLRKARRPR